MDLAERNKLVEQLLPIRGEVVREFIADRPSAESLEEDLMQDAAIILIEAVDNYAKCKQPGNINGYCAQAIRNGLLDAWNESSSELRPHRTTYVRKRKAIESEIAAAREKLKATPDNQALNDRMRRLIDELDESLNLNVEPIVEPPADYRVDPAKFADLIDDILDCCETDDELEIIELRADGKTDAKIGDEMGCDQKTVQRRRRKIEKKFFCTA